VLAQTPTAEEMPRLTNKEVLGMVQAGISSGVIIAKIKISRCAFDTDPTQLVELKSRGVPDEVLQAMIEAPYGLPKSAPKPSGSATPTERQPEPTQSSHEETSQRGFSTEPEYGTVQDIKALRTIFVRADDDDSRSTIIKMLSGYEGVEVVTSAKTAEIVLEYTTLTRDVAANRGPYAHGASMALKSQMRAYMIKPDGTKLIAWTETETFDVTNGFVLGASNEVNLTHHFVRDLQKARGEETYSLRKLFQNSLKHKK